MNPFRDDIEARLAELATRIAVLEAKPKVPKEPWRWPNWLRNWEERIAPVAMLAGMGLLILLAMWTIPTTTDWDRWVATHNCTEEMVEGKDFTLTNEANISIFKNLPDEDFTCFKCDVGIVCK